jgi:hypothetical protein
MSTGFHPNLDAESLGYEIAVKLFRFLTMFQSLLSVVSGFRIDCALPIGGST